MTSIDNFEIMSQQHAAVFTSITTGRASHFKKKPLLQMV